MALRDSIIGWRPQRDWDLNGTPERAHSGLVEQRDRWRHPEQFVEEKVETGWSEAKAEEIMDEACTAKHLQGKRALNAVWVCLLSKTPLPFTGNFEPHHAAWAQYAVAQVGR